MRVIEQLIEYFWQRGMLTHQEARLLVQGGFAPAEHFPDHILAEAPQQAQAVPAADPFDLIQDELETRDERRKAGSGGKPRHKGRSDRLQPLLDALGRFFDERQPFPALVEWGQRLGAEPTWRASANAILLADRAELEQTLPPVLDARPRVLSELWFWFDLEPLWLWATSRVAENSSGPIARAVARMLRAKSLHEAGRASQLLQSAAVRDLAALHGARRRFLDLLGWLYREQYANLSRWLAPGRGLAAEAWPHLARALIIAYNVGYWRRDEVAPGTESRLPVPTDTELSRALVLVPLIDPMFAITSVLLTRDALPTNSLEPLRNLTRIAPPEWGV